MGETAKNQHKKQKNEPAPIRTGSLSVMILGLEFPSKGRCSENGSIRLLELREHDLDLAFPQ